MVNPLRVKIPAALNRLFSRSKYCNSCSMMTWNFFLLLMAIAHLFQRVMAACPTGWTENSAANNGICYKMNINTGTGTNCAITCTGLSASMLCIISETDNDYARSFYLRARECTWDTSEL